MLAFSHDTSSPRSIESRKDLSRMEKKKIRKAGKQEFQNLFFSCFLAFLINHLFDSFSNLRASYSR